MLAFLAAQMEAAAHIEYAHAAAAGPAAALPSPLEDTYTYLRDILTAIVTDIVTPFDRPAVPPPLY